MTRNVFLRLAPLSCALAAVLVLDAARIGVAGAFDERGLEDLAKRVEKAVNSGDPVAVEGLTAAGVANDNRWIREWREGGNPRKWKAGIVRLPVRGRAPMLHVSRMQLCQSSNDHLYMIAGTPSRPELGREIPETALMGARVLSHRLSATFDPTAHRVAIEDDAMFERRPDTWQTCTFRLNACFSVTDVKVNGKPSDHVRAGGFLFVPKPAGNTATLSLKIGGILPSTGETFVASEESALTAYWYPHTGRLPATTDVRVSTPESWHGIATGRLVSETAADGVRTSRWRNDLPISYITVAAGRYTRTSRTTDGRTLSVWLRRHSANKAKEALDHAETAIRFFSDRIAPFPYDRYTVVESTIFPPALEAYSFTLVGTNAIPGVIVHEVSHTWWGGLIPNTYTRSMWNEAFATYSESLYRRLAESGDSAGTPGDGAAQAALNVPHVIPLRKVTDAMHPVHAGIGYGKGSLVLEQLERMFGTERMLSALRAFVARHRRGDDADWQDFEEALAAACGPEWKNALRAWLDHAGLPTFNVSGVGTRKTAGGYEVTGTLSSSPDGFWALIPLRLQTDGDPVVANVLIKGDPTEFRVQTRARPTELAVDPDGLVARTSSTSRMTLRVPIGP